MSMRKLCPSSCTCACTIFGGIMVAAPLLTYLPSEPDHLQMQTVPADVIDDITKDLGRTFPGVPR